MLWSHTRNLTGEAAVSITCSSSLRLLPWVTKSIRGLTWFGVRAPASVRHGGSGLRLELRRIELQQIGPFLTGATGTGYRTMHPFFKSLVQEALGAIRSLPLSVAGALAVICMVITWMVQSRSSRGTGEKVDGTNLLNSVDIVGKLGNLDQAPARRRVRATFRKTQMSLDHILFRGFKGVTKSEEVYEVNSRGMEIFTKNWLPETGPAKGLVFFCHGYGDTCTFFIEGIAQKLAGEGYGCFGMDYPGFGLSSGLHGYIPDFNMLVDDVIEHYSKVKAQAAFQDIPSFLFGESMGGAVALKVHFKQPTAWNGAVLVAPMCKIADNMYPPWPIFQLLKALAYLLPWAKLVPKRNLADLAFKDIKKRNQTPYNVASYTDRARLKTALELLKVTDDLSRQLYQVSLPMLILHGACDVVTDPSVSRALYEQASSGDKTIHLYKDAWHAIMEGEPDDAILDILNDIISWLDAHSTGGSASVQTASL